MLNIFVIDDILEHSNYICELVKKSRFKESIMVKASSDIKLFIDELEGEFLDFQILITDIDLVKYNGFDVAKKVLSIYPDCQIIFASGYSTFFEDAYFIDHTAFLCKPIKQSYLINAVNRAIDKINDQSAKKLAFVSDGIKTVLRVKDIIYAERRGRKTFVFTAFGDKYTTYDSIDTLLDKAANGELIRCHESYLFNIRHVISRRANSLILDNDTILTISRKYRKSIDGSILG